MDTRMSVSVKVEERLSKLESTMEMMMGKLTKIEQVIGSAGFDLLSKKVDEIADKQTIAELAMDDRVKDVISETDSKVAGSELRSEEKMKALGDKCIEAMDKALAIEIKLKDLIAEWPTPREGEPTREAELQWSSVINKRNAKKETKASLQESKPTISFAEKFKDLPNDTIVLIGDSLTRGVGAKLEFQSNMVSTICKPGANIDDITNEVSRLKNKVDRHLVLLVGTNDIKKEGSVTILSKYKNLLDKSKKVKNKKVTIVGIPRRNDLTNFHNSRRLGVNKYLREMCEAVNVEFIDYEPASSRLARDGLHLNHLGQDELGYKIFQNCRRFLV